MDIVPWPPELRFGGTTNPDQPYTQAGTVKGEDSPTIASKASRAIENLMAAPGAVQIPEPGIGPWSEVIETTELMEDSEDHGTGLRHKKLNLSHLQAIWNLRPRPGSGNYSRDYTASFNNKFSRSFW